MQKAAQADKRNGVCNRYCGFCDDDVSVGTVQQIVCTARRDSGDGADRYGDFYGIVFLFGHQCDYLFLFYVDWQGAGIGGNFHVAGACGAACLYLRTAGMVWHDRRVACRARDGGGDDLHKLVDGVAGELTQYKKGAIL